MGAALGIVVAALLVLCLLLAGGCSSRTPPSPPPNTASSSRNVAPPVTAASMKSLDRATVRALLKKLADTPPPAKLHFGAMCYVAALPPLRAEYVCPNCGQRTLYDNSKPTDGDSHAHVQGSAETVEWEIPQCRREFEKLRKVAGDAISFDESQFCRKCSPNIAKPKLVLHISYADGGVRDVREIDHRDIRMLREFLAGKLSAEADNEGERPLKDSLPRLQELLGVKPDE